MTTEQTTETQVPEATPLFAGPIEFINYINNPQLIMGLTKDDAENLFTGLYLALPNGDAILGPLMTHIPHVNEEDARQEAVDINDGKVQIYPYALLPKIEALTEPNIDFTEGAWKFDVRTIVEFGDFLENHTTLAAGDYTLTFADEYSAKVQYKAIAEENVKFNEAVEASKKQFAEIIELIKKPNIVVV